MSFYEQPAESLGYFHFQRRPAHIEAHFHGAPEFLFVERGEQEVTVSGETRVLKRGDGAFADGFCTHAYTQKTNDASAYVLLGEKSYFERIFALLGDRVPPRFFRFENFELLENLRLLCNEAQQNDGGRVAIERGAASILLGAMAKDIPFLKRSEDKQTHLVCNVLQYAETHLVEDLSLTRLSKLFGYSHEHLSRVLNTHLLEHWKSYVGRLRVRKAHALLEANETAPVLQIAFDCGFDSANTFYRAYKKEFGVPPRRKG